MAFVYDRVAHLARDDVSGVILARTFINTDGGGLVYRYQRGPDATPIKFYVRTIGDQGGPGAATERAKMTIEDIRIQKALGGGAMIRDFLQANRALRRELTEGQAMGELTQGMQVLLHRGGYEPSAPRFLVTWF